MKKYLLTTLVLLLFLIGVASGQAQSLAYSGYGPPQGNCYPGTLGLDKSSGILYKCNTGGGWIEEGGNPSSSADTRPSMTTVTGKNGVLNPGSSYQIFNLTGSGTITEIHITLGDNTTDSANLVTNSKLQIQCDGNFISFPLGLFYATEDAPKVFTSDFLSVPVMGSTYSNNSLGGIVFNRSMLWINYYNGCTGTIINGSATGTSNIFVDTTYRPGTPVTPVGAPTSRAYWNAYYNYLPAVPPNSGSFNTPQVYLMPTSSFSGGGELESIMYFVNAANQSYLESGPITYTDGTLAIQSGGGEDWAMCGYYCNFGNNELVSNRAGFVGGTFLQQQQGGGDAMLWRYFDFRHEDNVPFTNSLGVTSANGDAAFSTSPSIAMSSLVTFWTSTPTASQVQITPAPGTYTAAQTVSLTSYPAGAVTCYTTDGSTPTANNGNCTHGVTYTSPIAVPATVMINTISTKAGFNNGVWTSAQYTINIYAAPTYMTTCTQTAVSSNSTVASCTLPSVTANDMAIVQCSGGVASTGYTLTVNTSSGTISKGTLASDSTGSSQASVAFGLGGGSTTFTCTSATSVSYQTLQVAEYHPGSLTHLVSSAANTISSATGTYTSASVNTTGASFVVVIGDAQFVGTSPASGTIAGSAASNRTVNASGNAYIEDISLAASTSGVTGTLTVSNSGLWNGATLVLQ